MRAVHLGQVLPGVYPSTFTPEERGVLPGGKPSSFNQPIPVTATVVYIHPEGRYVAIEFRFLSGASFRECRMLRRRMARWQS